MSQAIGLIETRGMVGMIEATDAMVKAASVEMVKTVQIGRKRCGRDDCRRPVECV